MINFELTKHSKKRLTQRNIKDPNYAQPRLAKGIYIKKIRQRLRIKKRYTYFRSKIDNRSMTVYICRKREKNDYVLVTAFKINVIN